MAGFKLRETKESTAVSKNKIEQLSSVMDQLKERKSNLLEARTELERASIDEDAKKTMIDALNNSIEQNATEAKEVSDEISDETKVLEKNMQETQDAESETEKARGSMERKAAVLEKLGIDISGQVESLESQSKELNDLKQEIIDARKKGEDAQRIASLLGK